MYSRYEDVSEEILQRMVIARYVDSRQPSQTNDIICECSLKDILDNLALVNNFSIHRHQPFQMNHLHVYKMVQIALSWQKVLH